MADNKKKRLALIGTNGIPAQYGGGETFYENLTRGLASKYDITVYCSKTQPRDKVGDSYLGAKLKYWNLKANGWQSIIYDAKSILHAARHSDILYLFGPAGTFVVYLLRMFGIKKKVIMNCGGLNEWEREKFSPLAKWYLKKSFGIVKGRIIYVVDNNLYAKNLEQTFGIKNAVVIRYGGDNATKVEPDTELLKKYSFLNSEYYVSVSRAQIDNNLHILLDAFSKMPEKKLVLVSNFKVSDYGKEMYEKYQGYDNIVLIPGIYDKKEINAVRSNALAYIHSHSRCGTPPSLCEAMNLELPIISYDIVVNHEVTGEHAFFFSTPEDLQQVVLNTSKEELSKMAEKSYKLAKQELTWDYIWKKNIELFEN